MATFASNDLNMYLTTGTSLTVASNTNMLKAHYKGNKTQFEKLQGQQQLYQINVIGKTLMYLSS